MNLTKYYLIVTLLFTFLAAYNFVFVISYGQDVCQISKPTRILQFFQTSSNTTNTTTTSGAQLVKVTSSLHLAQIPTGIGILYIVMAFLTLLSSIGVRCFSQMLPERFAHLGWGWGAFGFFIRNNAKLIRLFHLIILILIIIQFIFIYGTADCKEAIHFDTTTLKSDVGQMWRESQLYNFVTLAFWGVLHCLMPFIKKKLSQEAFIYEPYDTEDGKLKYFCCTFAGPN